MTAAECNAYFDLLIDKVEGAYFTDDEVDTFITQACIEYIKSHLPSTENNGQNYTRD